MKKIVFPFVLIGSALVGLLYSNYSEKELHVEPIAIEEEDKAHPGWLEQYWLMKHNEQGEIPSGMYRQWRAQESRNKKQSSLLDSVRELGPYNVGGRTRSILIDQTDPQHILSGGISGGIWESEDGGDTWHAINDFAPNLTVTSITQNPFRPNEIYYSTGEPSGNSAGIPGEGVFKSEDGGKTFTQLSATLNDDFDYTWKVVHSLTDSNTLYVATEADGLFASYDAGDSFTRIYSTSNDIHDIEVFEDSSIIIAVERTGLFRTTSETQPDFQLMGGGLPTTNIGRGCIAYSKQFPQNMYAQFGDNGNDALRGVYRSTDGGFNWVQVGDPATQANVAYSFPWYCFLLEVSPNNPDRLMTGCVHMAFSLDGGDNWTRGDNSHADYHTAAFWEGTDDFIIGNDGGVYEYNWQSIGSNSTDLNEGYNVTQFYTGAYFPTGLSVVAGTQDNGTQAALDGDPNFTRVLGGDGAFAQVHQQNPSTIYASSQNGNIRRIRNVLTNPIVTGIRNELDSDNNGSIDDGAWFINPFEINLNNGNQLFFPTQRRLWRSDDEGDSWEPITEFVGFASGNNSVYAVGISNELNPTVYIGGSSLLIYRIDNASIAQPGSEVSLRTSAPNGLLGSFISNIEVHPNDPSVIFVALSNFSTQPRIYRVSEANTANPTWTPINGDLPESLPVNWIEVDPVQPDRNFYIGTDFGVYTSNNGGQTWEKETRIPNVSVHQVRLRDSDRTLFIFTHGRGAWSAKLKPDVNTSIDETAAFRPLSIYPNPAQDYIAINWPEELTNPTVQVVITDMQGKEVWVQQLTATYQSSIDISQLLPAQYVISLRSGNKLWSERLIKR